MRCSVPRLPFFHAKLGARGFTILSSRNKVVSLEDAAAIVHNGDTVSCSGFVAQGAPEALLEALGKRFMATGEPKELTVFFGGGPGDFETKGLNHLGVEREDGSLMVRRTIGSHYGQIPMLANLVLKNRIEGYTLPLGSISRMTRATAASVPGHITRIGMGTFVDPNCGTGGKLNGRTKEDIVSRITVGDQEWLYYKAVPINVAFIRATTSDPEGNLTFEHESVLADAKVLAMAARNSGGVVVAQVKRLAANGSIPARKVHVPGSLVDCIVVVDPEDHKDYHSMSYFENHNPAWSQEVRVPLEEIPPLPLNARKMIARRAAYELKSQDTVNLGIGMPDGVASVANEEHFLHRITLSTEVGLFGGLGATGHNFGPATNAAAFVEMNQMFDFYNGGGLDVCFLGCGQVSSTGDVNVSRMVESKLTGPGGFMDITQATARVVYMGTFTARGLQIGVENGELRILQEGKIMKFVNQVREVTFSGDMAVKTGQSVLYITERAVFQLGWQSPELELVEIAPGIDLEKDVLSQMEFEPKIAENLKTMDHRIFEEGLMNLNETVFGVDFRERLEYDATNHVVYIDNGNLNLTTLNQVHEYSIALEAVMRPIYEESGRFDVVANYENFDCRDELAALFASMVQEIEAKYYKSASRYAGHAFFRAKLGKELEVLDEHDLFPFFDQDGNGQVSAKEMRAGLERYMRMNVSDDQLQHIMGFPESGYLDENGFYLQMNKFFSHRLRQKP
ncbi:hypothetical protein AAMO2058_000212300 [Amorphochlora amoebiformis]